MSEAIQAYPTRHEVLTASATDTYKNLVGLDIEGTGTVTLVLQDSDTAVVYAVTTAREMVRNIRKVTASTGVTQIVGLFI